MMIFAVSSRLEWVIKVSLAPSNLNLLQFLYTLVAMDTIVVILFLPTKILRNQWMYV